MSDTPYNYDPDKAAQFVKGFKAATGSKKSKEEEDEEEKQKKQSMFGNLHKMIFGE